MSKRTRQPADLPQGHDAYQHIVAGIRQGELVPGERLVEAELAERFGISRTPVREAIRRLESEGLVVHVPRMGAAVRQLDHVEVSELYDMRSSLEGTAARFAARAASDIELAELETIHAELEQASAVADHVRINRQFHQALYGAARNRWLLRSLNSVNDTLLILGTTTLTDAARATSAVAEHAKVLEALLARDFQGAEAAMRAHIDAAHRARLRQRRVIGDDDVS